MKDKRSGQGFVGGAESVHQPTGDTGKALAKESGGKLEHGRCMVVRARIHGVNESHVVDVIGKMGEKIGNPGPAFAVLLEGKGEARHLPLVVKKPVLESASGRGLPWFLLRTGL